MSRTLRVSEELTRKAMIDAPTRPTGQSARRLQVEEAGCFLHDH